MFDLEPYGGTGLLGMFPLFLMRTSDAMPPRLSVVFRRLVCMSSFPACWRQAYVTQIPKGPPSYSVANYTPISIPSVLFTVFKGLVSVRLGRFMERHWYASNHSVCYRKRLGTCDALLYMSLTLQSALDSGQEARIVQIDFSAAFDMVNLKGILYTLCSVGIGGFVLSTLTQFLSNRSLHFMVEGYRSKHVNIVSGVQQGSVFLPLEFLI